MLDFNFTWRKVSNPSGKLIDLGSYREGYSVSASTLFVRVGVGGGGLTVHSAGA